MSDTPILTQWGYFILVDDQNPKIAPLISVSDFNTATGSRYASKPDVSLVLDAVSLAIRNECGWHIAPNYDCGIYLSPDSSVVKLPSLCVTSLEGVFIDEQEQDTADYEWQARGLLRMKHGYWPQGWNRVFVEFMSGYANDPLLQQLVTQIAVNHMAAAPGIREEQAGAVRISYNQTASGVTGGVTLLPRELEMVSAYKLQTGVV